MEEDSGSDVSRDDEGTKDGTHHEASPICIDTQDVPLQSSSPNPDEQLRSPRSISPVGSCGSALLMGHLWDSPSASPSRPSSPKQPVSGPDTAVKLAPADPRSPRSGQHSADSQDCSALDAGHEPQPSLLGDLHSPGQSGPSKDSFVQPDNLEVVSEGEVGAKLFFDPQQVLNITMESGAQAPMDCALVEELHAKAAEQFVLAEDCLNHITVHAHPSCEHPHVYGVESDMVYYMKIKIPEQMGHYNEFHEWLERNNMNVSVVEDTHPFLLHHVIAHLLHAGHSLPADLLPSMEESLGSQPNHITTDKDSLQQFIHKMDRKLDQVVLQEAATPVKVDIGGSIIPQQWDSDSSFQSVDTTQLDSLLTAYEAVERQLPLGPVKLEDQLLLLFSDRSALECEDYTWRHPELRCKSFQAPHQFCEDGQWIPFLFQGSEQLGKAALQIPVGAKTPVGLVQAALLHQCDEAAKAIQIKLQEIHSLERFVADAQTACFRVSAGDLQISLLAAGVSPHDLQFPSIPQETQETSCQGGPVTQSTATQDGTGIAFIDHKLQDCELHPSSTQIMDEYLVKSGYEPGHGGNVSNHSFPEGPHVIRAATDCFKLV